MQRRLGQWLHWLHPGLRGTSTGCQILGTVLSASTAGTCLVTATKSGDANYNSTTSAVATETFSPASKLTQATVTLSSVSTTYPYSVDLSTLVGGGSGTGAFGYSLLTEDRPVVC